MFDVTKTEMYEELTQDLGLGALSDEKKEEAMSALGENLMKRITMAILDVVPSERHEEYSNYVEKGEQEALMKLISEYIPDFDAFMQGVVQKEVSIIKQTAAGT